MQPKAEEPAAVQEEGKTAQKPAPGDEFAGLGKLTEAQLRLSLMRFADRFAQAVSHASDRIEREAETPDLRLAALEGKLAYVTSALDIAVGPYPFVNLMDMVAFVTLSRIQIEKYWIPNVYGASGEELLEVFRRHESEIWSLSNQVLTPEQQR